jgi:hypothetical protein
MAFEHTAGYLSDGTNTRKINALSCMPWIGFKPITCDAVVH